MKRLPRVKVCGLTRQADARAALEVGAQGLGFVAAAESPRALKATQVAAICAGLPGDIERIGVFVDSSPDEVADFARVAGLSAIQLCGAEQPGDYSEFHLPILRRLPADEHGAAELELWRGLAWGFVIDHPGSAGGSGQRVDLELARSLAQAAPCLLAGGLDESNVAEAIRRVEPSGVDASSRLELSAGRKDQGRLRAFIAQALAEWEENDG
ncbi:MAG: phosphoribosylanthranilate isomerase [Planctomycetota bacterium]|nr:phosphoribosylanthranilate isomerase [Planctomycetota bacterium]